MNSDDGFPNLPEDLDPLSPAARKHRVKMNYRMGPNLHEMNFVRRQRSREIKHISKMRSNSFGNHSKVPRYASLSDVVEPDVEFVDSKYQPSTRSRGLPQDQVEGASNLDADDDPS